MVFSKIKKISFILLILFILLFPFWCVRGLCAEEISFHTVNGIIILKNQNFFTTNTNNAVGYIEIEKGYTYTITNNSGYTRQLAYSNDIPAVNVPYTYIMELPSGESYSFMSDTNTYLYFAFSNTPSVTITRDVIQGQTSAINGLVDNVGVSQIWGIFDISINYIVVVVLFAFGVYIIFRIIRKISRGKEGL